MSRTSLASCTFYTGCSETTQTRPAVFPIFRRSVAFFTHHFSPRLPSKHPLAFGRQANFWVQARHPLATCTPFFTRTKL